MSARPVRKAAPKLWMARQLLLDFAGDLRGDPDGLTAPELGRAWQARHGAGFPEWALGKLAEQGAARALSRRQCVVSGRRLLAWVPVGGLDGATQGGMQ